jgi:hypothetical protein
MRTMHFAEFLFLPWPSESSELHLDEIGCIQEGMAVDSELDLVSK